MVLDKPKTEAWYVDADGNPDDTPLYVNDGLCVMVPNGDELILISYNGPVEVINLQNHTLLRTYNHGGDVVCGATMVNVSFCLGPNL